MKPTESLVGLVFFFFVKFFVPYLTTAYGQLRKTTITKDFFYGLSCSLKVLFVEKLQEGRVTIEEAAEDAGMTVEKFKKVMENTSLQAV